MKHKISILIIITILMMGIAYGVECGVTPTEDCTMTANTTFYTGTYYLNDTNANGAIQVGANSFTLDCNGSYIIGNNTVNSRGFQIAAKNNITLKNCNIQNFSIGIRTTVSYDININNMNISNVLTRGISLENTNYTNITNNIIKNATGTGSGTAGVLLSGVNNQIEIKNNIIERFYDLINFADNNLHNGTVISDNNLTHSYEYCIYFRIGTNYSTVYNNRLLDCGWEQTANAIDLWGYYNNISNNYIYNFSHQGIDLFTTDATVGGFNTIESNTINASFSDDNNCIFLSQSNNNTVYNNTCDGRIQAVGNSSYQYGNEFYLNKIHNALYSMTAKTDSYWHNNIIFNSLYNDIYIQSDNTIVTSPLFINNDYNSGISKYFLEGDVNTSINETSLSYHILNITSSGIITLMYNGRKDLTIINNTVKINNMPTAFNQVFNGTDITPQCENQNECNVTLGAGQRSFVFSQASATEPKPTSIATAITAYTLTYVSGTSVSIDCTGSGSHTIANLDTITYPLDVYHNDVFVERIVSSTYTMDGCSNWELIYRTPQQQVAEDVNPELKESLLGITRWFPLFVLIIIGGLIVGSIIVIKNGEVPSFSEIEISSLVGVLFYGMMAIVVAILILVAIAGG